MEGAFEYQALTFRLNNKIKKLKEKIQNLKHYTSQVK